MTACGVCGCRTGDGSQLCGGHRADIARLLVQVPWVLRTLADRSAGLIRSGGGAGGSDEHRIPWDDRVQAAIADYRARICLACLADAQESAEEVAGRRLAAYRTWGGPDTHRALTDAHRAAESALTPEGRWFAGVCSAWIDEGGPTCTRNLYARRDSGVVECPSCGTRWNVDERREIMRDVLDDALVTVREFVTAAPHLLGQDVRVGRVEKWAERGKVTSRGVRHVEVLVRAGGMRTVEAAVYRFADLAALADARATRQAS